MRKQQLMKRAQKHAAEVVVYAMSGECTVDVQLPIGKRWVATGHHVISLTGWTAAETYAAVGEDMAEGTEVCPADCWCWTA